MKNRNVRLVFAALCAALMCVSAFFSIPLGGINMTLQVFAVAFAGCFLGTGYGTLAVAAYILLGACGLPVFAGFCGGLSVLVGPTGGFILGFLPLAAMCGIKKYPLMLSWTGLILCHGLGVTAFSLTTGTDFLKSILVASLPYFLKDGLLVLFARKTAEKILKYEFL